MEWVGEVEVSSSSLSSNSNIKPSTTQNRPHGTTSNIMYRPRLLSLKKSRTPTATAQLAKSPLLVTSTPISSSIPTGSNLSSTPQIIKRSFPTPPSSNVPNKTSLEQVKQNIQQGKAYLIHSYRRQILQQERNKQQKSEDNSVVLSQNQPVEQNKNVIPITDNMNSFSVSNQNQIENQSNEQSSVQYMNLNDNMSFEDSQSVDISQEQEIRDVQTNENRIKNSEIPLEHSDLLLGLSGYKPNDVHESDNQNNLDNVSSFDISSNNCTENIPVSSDTSDTLQSNDTVSKVTKIVISSKDETSIDPKRLNKTLEAVSNSQEDSYVNINTKENVPSISSGNDILTPGNHNKNTDLSLGLTVEKKSNDSNVSSKEVHKKVIKTKNDAEVIPIKADAQKEIEELNDSIENNLNEDISSTNEEDKEKSQNKR